MRAEHHLADLSEDEWKALLKQKMRGKSKALGVRPVDLANSLRTALKRMGDQPFAFIVIHEEGEFKTAAVPAKNGVVQIPPGAELITAFLKGCGGLRMTDVAILHCAGCPTLSTDLMSDCRCQPEFRIQRLGEQ